MSGWLRLAALSLVAGTSTVLHATPLLLVALLKALLPVPAWRRLCNHALTGLAESWIAVNNGLLRHCTDTRISVCGADGLRRDGHYLVIANHQSWVDILVLQYVFNRRIPLLRFFLKRQLFWIPVLGLAWWALDFPFMGRYTRRQIARNPELGRRDMEATRRACEKFRELPVAVMNFVEGTRFTDDKHARQGSPYRHLIKPKSGGIAFVIDAMGEGLQAMLDVTLAYPAGRPGMRELLLNQVPQVHVRVQQRPVPRDLVPPGWQQEPAVRARFQQWLNGIWQEKDRVLAAWLEADDAPPAADCVPPDGRAPEAGR